MKKPERETLLRTLKRRFDDHPARHLDLTWAVVEARLEANSAALEALHGMEASGGEPDVVGYDTAAGRITFVDCSAESPAGRRSLCYDGSARNARKEHTPEGSAVEMAESIGITLLTEEQYRALQRLGEFDARTSSWISTPPEIRALGGALFGDRRFGRVFVYHNGAQSYYAARGFRGCLHV